MRSKLGYKESKDDTAPLGVTIKGQYLILSLVRFKQNIFGKDV